MQLDRAPTAPAPPATRGQARRRLSGAPRRPTCGWPLASSRAATTPRIDEGVPGGFGAAGLSRSSASPSARRSCRPAVRRPQIQDFLVRNDGFETGRHPGGVDAARALGYMAFTVLKDAMDDLSRLEDFRESMGEASIEFDLKDQPLRVAQYEAPNSLDSANDALRKRRLPRCRAATRARTSAREATWMTMANAMATVRVSCRRRSPSQIATRRRCASSSRPTSASSTTSTSACSGGARTRSTARCATVVHLIDAAHISRRYAQSRSRGTHGRRSAGGAGRRARSGRRGARCGTGASSWTARRGGAVAAI